LPAFTRAFMSFYDILRFNLHYIIGFVLISTISAVLAYRKTQKGHYIFSKIALAFPLLGKVLSQSFIAIFCRTMSTLIAAGVPVLEVLDILAEMSDNDIITSSVKRVKEQIVGGSSISVSMASTPFFPNMVSKMVQVGEESGSISRVLDRTTDYYE